MTRVQLLEKVRADVQALQTRVKARYEKSEAHLMATVRDVPPVGGLVLWMRQMKGQLNTYMQRVELILGRKLDEDSEGMQLKVVLCCYGIPLVVDRCDDTCWWHVFAAGL